MLSAALASATTSAPSHWIIFFLNGRSAPGNIALGGCRSIPTLADSLLFQHRPSFESGSALGANFPTRMLGVHLLCKELNPKQPNTETPRLKSQGLCPFGHQGRISAQQAYSQLYAATRQTALCLERLSGPDKRRYCLRLRVLRQCGKRGLSR
jgi:hypothetical protein